jgi:hypothetical protein
VKEPAELQGRSDTERALEEGEEQRELAGRPKEPEL